MRASVGMAGGLLLVGLSGYVFLAVTGHSSTPSDAAALSSLYFLAGLVTLGVFVGLEQETSRATSRAVAERRALAPVVRGARRHAVWLFGGTVGVLAVLSPVVVSGPLRGRWDLFGVLVVAAGVGAACYWVRGVLGGLQEFWGYAATLAVEGLARLVPCVAVFLAAGRGGAAWAYGLAFGAAQGFAAGAGLWWLRGGFEGGGEAGAKREGIDAEAGVKARSRGIGAGAAPGAGVGSSTGMGAEAEVGDAQAGAEPSDVEISSFESGERSAAGGLALLVAGSLLTQLVANLPPLVASTRLAHSDAMAAAFGQAFVLVRIPLLLISPIQAMLLPDLTRSAARGDHAAVRGRVRVALAAVAALGVMGTAALAGAGPWVLRVFFGTRAGLSHELLGVLGVGTVFLMAAAILQPTLVAMDRHRWVPIAWAVGAVVLGVLVELPVDPLHAAAAGGVGGPVAVVAVMAVGVGGALRDKPLVPGSGGEEGAVPEGAAAVEAGGGGEADDGRGDGALGSVVGAARDGSTEAGAERASEVGPGDPSGGAAGGARDGMGGAELGGASGVALGSATGGARNGTARVASGDVSGMALGSAAVASAGGAGGRGDRAGGMAAANESAEVGRGDRGQGPGGGGLGRWGVGRGERQGAVVGGVARWWAPAGGSAGGEGNAEARRGAEGGGGAEGEGGADNGEVAGGSRRIAPASAAGALGSAEGAAREGTGEVMPGGAGDGGGMEEAGGRSAAGGARRVVRVGVETAAALVAAAVMVGAARLIDVNPLERVGQVSALAALQVRFTVLGLVLLGALVVVHRWGGARGYLLAKGVVCGALAGLASGFLAGGIVVALRGTPWPLFGLSGDTGRLVEWSASIVHGHGSPNPTYPPLTLHALAWWAQVFHHGDTASAFRDMEIGGAAVTGPAAYLAWRFVLSPVWALVVGVVPAYSIIDPYKPYGAVVMIVLLPLFVVSVRHTMRVGDMAWRRVLGSAALFGVLYSVLFLTYPGSSLWSAPGLVGAVLLLFPWAKERAGERVGKLLAFVGVTVAVFGVLCGWYVKDLVGPGNVDRAYGFDAYTDPAFFSMWRTDMPGDVGQWPPPGELAGLGLFSVLTFAGLGVALWLGWRRPLAVTVACVFIGTWLWRMEVASRMWATGTVQLWPRTGNQLLYCILVLGAAATAFAASRLASWPPVPSRLGAHVGVLTAVMLVLGSAASSVSDYWMPAKTNSYKILAYVSQTMRKPDGTCPKYAPNHECSATGDQSWMNNFAGPRNH